MGQCVRPARLVLTHCHHAETSLVIHDSRNDIPWHESADSSVDLRQLPDTSSWILIGILRRIQVNHAVALVVESDQLAWQLWSA